MGLIKCLLCTFSCRLVLLVLLPQPPYPFVSPFLHTHTAEDVWAVSNLLSPLVLLLKAGSVRHWQVLMHCSFSSFACSGGIF